MLSWQFYSAIVFVCVAVGSFLYKRARMQGARPGSFMVVQAGCFLGVVLLAGFISGEWRFDNPYLGLGLLCGCLGMTGAFSTLRSMGRGELGPNISVVRLSFVPTTIGAILFLGEPLSLRKVALFAFAGLAVFLFVDHYRRENRSALTSLVPALTACFAFGFFDLVYKIAAMKGVSPLAFVLVQTATGNVLINLYVIFREKYQINRVILRIAPLCGILFASACLAWFHALRQVDVSLIAPFIQMNFVFTYILGVLFLRESVTARKLMGITLVVLSILLLSDYATQELAELWSTLIQPGLPR